LDAFATETPIVTTNYPFHSPEIEYLVHKENGIICNNGGDEYAEAVVSVLEDKDLLNRLRQGCRRYASRYTNERMVNNFTEGVVNALNSPQSQKR
jgi:glycosyltransferase involved in cell wall biosynthesis